MQLRRTAGSGLRYSQTRSQKRGSTSEGEVPFPRGRFLPLRSVNDRPTTPAALCRSASAQHSAGVLAPAAFHRLHQHLFDLLRSSFLSPASACSSPPRKCCAAISQRFTLSWSSQHVSNVGFCVISSFLQSTPGDGSFLLCMTSEYSETYACSGEGVHGPADYSFIPRSELRSG